VLVMLFQGFSIDQKIAGPLDRSVGDPWRGHPFHRDNNINGIDGDPEGTGRGRLVHTLALPRVLALQERFVRRVVRMLNNQDNVIWEISNESPATSMRWQYHMASFVKDLEEQLPKQHPVLVTVPWGPAGAGENDELFASPADAISPNPKGGYKDAPPPADGSKIVINDTDHLWGIGGTADWVWQAFLAGQHPIFMDPYLDVRTGEIYDAQWESVRRAMGHTLCYAQRLKMAEMAPADRMVDAGRCLACPGTTYLIWLPLGKTEVSLDLTGAEGPFSVEWFRPDTEELFDGREAMGGAIVRLKRPDAAYRIGLVRTVE